jgi:penicillin-binding protein 2
VRAPGEKRYRPIPPQVVNTLGWSPATLRTVRGGMHDVVMSPRGTGRLAQIPDVEMAGKTGTAEVGRKGEGHKIGWMIAFAPFDHPRYAVVLMVEEAVTGGTTVAPRMQKVMHGLFDNEKAGEGQG